MCNGENLDQHVPVVVNFLSQVTFVFLLFLGMVIRAELFKARFR